VKSGARSGYEAWKQGVNTFDVQGLKGFHKKIADRLSQKSSGFHLQPNKPLAKPALWHYQTGIKSTRGVTDGGVIG
jgi:hypothetical protein